MCWLVFDKITQVKYELTDLCKYTVVPRLPYYWALRSRTVNSCIKWPFGPTLIDMNIALGTIRPKSLLMKEILVKYLDSGRISDLICERFGQRPRCVPRLIRYYRRFLCSLDLCANEMRSSRIRIGS